MFLGKRLQTWSPLVERSRCAAGGTVFSFIASLRIQIRSWPFAYQRRGRIPGSLVRPPRGVRGAPRPLGARPPGSADGQASPTWFYSAGGRRRAADGRNRAGEPREAPAGCGPRGQPRAGGGCRASAKERGKAPPSARRSLSCRGPAEEKKSLWILRGSAKRPMQNPGETPLRGRAACAARPAAGAQPALPWAPAASPALPGTGAIRCETG